MSWLLSFWFLNSHSTFRTIVSSLTFIFLVRYDILSWDHFLTVNTRHFDIGANSLMPINFTTNAFCFAMFVLFTFNRSIWAIIVMWRHSIVLEHLCASHHVMTAFELHFLKLLLNFLLNAQEFGLFALHGTHTCFVMEFFKTFMMESLLAWFTLYRIN